MPTDTNFNPTQLAHLKKVVKAAGVVWTNAQVAYIHNLNIFGEKFNTWFGKSTPASKEISFIRPP